MSFSSRLSRFGKGSGANPGAKNVDGNLGDDADSVRRAHATEASEPGENAPTEAEQGTGRAHNSILEDLRARMAKALSKHETKLPRGHDSEGEASVVFRESLPLEVVESPSGATFERRLRGESLDARVGPAALTDALEASMPWLSMLALDESLAVCNIKEALFLDTETTGLSGGTGTVAFLVGLAWWSEDDGRFMTELLFLPTFASEEPMLDYLAARLRKASFLVTFNGKSFDIPLLKTRYALHRKAFPFEGPHLDLLHVARRIHRGREFSVRLQSLEQVLFGLEREGDIPSSQVPQAYLAWLRGGDSAPVRAVLEHNTQDVLTMVALVGLYGRPLGQSLLHGKELVAAARAAKKAGNTTQAGAVLAVAEGRGIDDSFARDFHLEKAALYKHEGSWADAATSYEEARAWLDDDRVRLELAKVYEHRLRDAKAALTVAEQGTGEVFERATKRKQRLTKKLTAPKQRKLPGVS